ncbi:unnamed protein product [Brassica rapa]|uniref:Uncharacterized protein n=1 Tax=Brassica campestris TaxID=3711 RepID=A0A3P5YMM1_BRACM|nr:unnamed protein product [Brassica rapa]VDC62600.1 unnamed protein product [Brassica rapa]
MARPCPAGVLVLGFYCQPGLAAAKEVVYKLFLVEPYPKERIIGHTNFYRVPTLAFTWFLLLWQVVCSELVKASG